jgi:hypothetical protein
MLRETKARSPVLFARLFARVRPVPAIGIVVVRMMDGAKLQPPQTFKLAGFPGRARSGWVMQLCHSSDLTAKLFPFPGGGLTCIHAVI